MTENKKMSESARKDIESLFKLFDRNNDELITKNDLRLVLSEFGNPGEEEIQTIYNQMGVKQSEKITFKQFSKCIETYYYDTDKASEEEALKRSFKMFDKNGNGTIDIKELRKVLTSIGEKLSDKEVDTLFKEADKNKDGMIQYDEFVKMFTKDMKV